MPTEPDDKSEVLAGIFDTILATDGLPHLGKSEIAMIVYLWRHGHIETEGIPAKDRFAAGDALGLRRSATYEVFRTLMQVGLLRRSDIGGITRYGLNTCWRPSWPGGASP
jgi:hypothetical protein